MDKHQGSSAISWIDPDPASRVFSRFRLWVAGSPKWVPIFYLALLALAETTTTFWDPRLGIALHGACLLSLILHAALFSRGRRQFFLLSFALSPLIRLLSLTLPLLEFPFAYWYMVVGIPLFLATILLIRITKVSVEKVGINLRAPLWQILVGLTGILLGYLEYLILRPPPLVADFKLGLILVPALILLVFTGFLEELMFRGVFQYFSIRTLGPWGFIFTALVFAVLHIGYHSFLDMAFVLLVAFYFGYVVLRTGSILGVTLAHGLTNIGLFLVFPFIANIPLVLPDILPAKQLEIPATRTPAISTPIIPLFAQGKLQPTVTGHPFFFFQMTVIPDPQLEIMAGRPTLVWASTPWSTWTPNTPAHIYSNHPAHMDLNSPTYLNAIPPAHLDPNSSNHRYSSVHIHPNPRGLQPAGWLAGLHRSIRGFPFFHQPGLWFECG